MLSHKNFIPCIMLMLAVFSVCSLQKTQAQNNKGYYMLKVYHLKNNAQQQLTESYLKDFYVPKLHKLNIKNVGVFKTLDQDTADQRIYVLIPFGNWKNIENLDANVSHEVTQAGRDYIDADFKNPPYTRMETIILNAFTTRPSPSVPKLTAPTSDRVYELRSYEGATEQYHRNKVKMFNSGETDLFDRIGSNPVFYGSVVAGAKMPNLMYMTAYDSMKERDKHWEVFVASPEWKGLIAKDEYKNNMSKMDITFLHPTNYSDF